MWVWYPSLVCWKERMEAEGKNPPLTGWSRIGPSSLVGETSSDIPEPPGQEFWAHPPGRRPRPNTTWWDQTPHLTLESQVCCPGGVWWISGSPEVTGPHPDLDKCSKTAGNQMEQNKSDLEGTIKIILIFDVPFLSSFQMRFDDCFNAHLPSLIHHQSS